MPDIISLSGKKRHGKNTVANYLSALYYEKIDPTYFKSAIKKTDDLSTFLDNSNAFHTAQTFVDTYGLIIPKNSKRFNIEQKSFAHKVKQCASIILNISIEVLDSSNFKDTYLKDWGMTGREFLQKLGTDAMRFGLHRDVWVKALLSDLNEKSKWIVTDTRFLNEISALVKLNSKNIYVFRPNFTKVKYKGTKEDFYLTDLSFEKKMWRIEGADIHNNGINIWCKSEDIIFSKEDSHLSETEMDFNDNINHVFYNTSKESLFEQCTLFVENNPIY